MRRKKPERDLQRVVDRVLPSVPTERSVGKADFEVILAAVMGCVQEKTKASAEQLEQLTPKVLGDLPNEYGRLDERERSWPALIVYLYSKYLSELEAGS
jgi:hypothetical protein